MSVQERWLRWLGHVQGVSDDRIAKQVLHWIPEERRKRGWPRVTWQHVISKDTSSSRMHVMDHNWSATKQRLHPQSVVKISRHSVLSGDRI